MENGDIPKYIVAHKDEISYMPPPDYLGEDTMCKLHTSITEAQKVAEKIAAQEHSDSYILQVITKVSAEYGEPTIIFEDLD
jgi:hypothetical protein